MDLADLIRVLRANGVQSATFNRAGDLTGIQFFATATWTGDPVEELEQD